MKSLNEITNLINDDWKEIFENEYGKTYFKNILEKINKDYSSKIVFPKKNQIFKAFKNTSFSDIKVLILGQDPYHGFDQANGLCFSVNKKTKLPPSLKNIFKELSEDINCKINHGDLNPWTKQGVFLLNTSLTVVQGNPGSHSKIGWEIFTDNIIKQISNKKQNVVFMFWGNHAIKKEKLITNNKHLILKCAHPSPLSAYRGFFGSKHFSKANSFLKKNNIEPIQWEIT
jgi:uracil-DNA glycosylase